MMLPSRWAVVFGVSALLARCRSHPATPPPPPRRAISIHVPKGISSVSPSTSAEYGIAPTVAMGRASATTGTLAPPAASWLPNTTS